MRINVKGGTNAGWRHPKATPTDWTCPGCNAELKKHWTRCPDCKTPRP